MIRAYICLRIMIQGQACGHYELSFKWVSPNPKNITVSLEPKIFQKSATCSGLDFSSRHKYLQNMEYKQRSLNKQKFYYASTCTNIWRTKIQQHANKTTFPVYNYSYLIKRNFLKKFKGLKIDCQRNYWEMPRILTKAKRRPKVKRSRLRRFAYT